MSEEVKDIHIASLVCNDVVSHLEKVRRLIADLKSLQSYNKALELVYTEIDHNIIECQTHLRLVVENQEETPKTEE